MSFLRCASARLRADERLPVPSSALWENPDVHAPVHGGQRGSSTIILALICAICIATFQRWRAARAFDRGKTMAKQSSKSDQDQAKAKHAPSAT